MPRKTAAVTDADADATAARATRASGRTRTPSARAQAAAAVAQTLAEQKAQRASSKPPSRASSVKPPSRAGSAKPPSRAGSVKPASRAGSVKPRSRAGSVKPATSKPVSKAKAPVSKAKAPPSKAKAPVSKAKGRKRARDEDSDDDDGEEPEAKKVKADDTTLDAIVEDEEEEEEQGEEEKMVTVVQRGAAPVDPCSGLVDTHQVSTEGGEVWDAMLNQSDVGKNSNKFYVIQLLHPIGNPNSVSLFTRWGRVGENGQKQTKGPWGPSTGVSQFKSQFKAKSGVEWSNRHGMVAAKGKYTFLERDYEEDEEETKKASKGEGEEPEKVPDSKLPAEIQALCKLIFSTRLMDAHLKSMQYDANKLPLGKLSKATIMNGFAALKELSEVLDKPTGDVAKEYGGFKNAVDTLTGRYYSIIPHIFSRASRPTPIDELGLLKRELDLVDALGDMEVASKLIASSVLTDDDGQPINQLDAHFRSLRLSSMAPISRRSKSLRDSNDIPRTLMVALTAITKVNIQNAYRVERQDETEAWLKAGFDKTADGDRLLLWHGSRTTNFAGILKQGLRIAPPEAPVTGYMFGKGVYFADMMSKSANYCYAHLSDNTGLLLLCEVAAAPFYEQKNANYDADRECKDAGALCTKGLGRTQPAEWQDAGDTLQNDDLKGCLMPKGPGKDVTDPGVYLQYNEYIVYNPAQIRVRYLLMVDMK
ncbi:hypothetical protein QCA50_008646 [Cerrena zonata]|uniref:Poly [ADP-ribose] polymerase n=1 Tax=Cerrena zonata TaxID=2478898 RepID=A0AAW0GFK6_9APHY